MTHLKPGDKAPFFKGIDQNGNEISLDDFKGKKLILYFYPKDNTPGCTAEACDLRDHYQFWLEKGYAVVGVSPDSVKSHQRFAEKYNLPFPLIADPDKEILKAYGVWGLKKNYGREYEGVFRTTFIINEEGIIEEVFKKVKTKEHTKQILEKIEK
jgi:peroxiredoxin Q/BCP